MTTSMIRSMTLLMCGLCLLFSSTSIAQSRGISMKNQANQQVDFIPENKRIQVTTYKGDLYIGKFTIVDATHIRLDQAVVALDEMASVQRQPLLCSLLSTLQLIPSVALCLYGIEAGGLAVFLSLLMGVPIMLGILTTALGNKHQHTIWSYTLVEQGLSTLDAQPLPTSKPAEHDTEP